MSDVTKVYWTNSVGLWEFDGKSSRLLVPQIEIYSDRGEHKKIQDLKAKIYEQELQVKRRWF
jgi:hypothetical protein